MEIKHHTKDYIILEDMPMFGPVAAISFIGAGMITVIIIYFRFPHHMLLALWGGLVALLGFILLFRLRERSQIILDRSRNLLLFVRKKPLGKHIEESYKLGEVKDFGIETSPDDNGQRIIAILKNDQQVPFTNPFAKGTIASYPGICRTLRQYVGLTV